jgi:hypothetical protein
MGSLLETASPHRSRLAPPTVRREPNRKSFPIWEQRQDFIDGGRRRRPSSKTVPDRSVQIPIEAGRVFRFEAGHGSDMKPATIPN